MRLHISDSTGTLPLAFGTWLCGKIRMLLISSVDFKKLKSWTDYLNEKETFPTLGAQLIDAQKIFMMGADSLICTGSDGDLSILINPNIFLIGYNQVKVSVACRLINFGDTQHVGYPIFTNVFELVSKDISKYVDQYMLFN